MLLDCSPTLTMCIFSSYRLRVRPPLRARCVTCRARRQVQDSRDAERQLDDVTDIRALSVPRRRTETRTETLFERRTAGTLNLSGARAAGPSSREPAAGPSGGPSNGAGPAANGSSALSPGSLGAVGGASSSPTSASPLPAKGAAGQKPEHPSVSRAPPWAPFPASSGLWSRARGALQWDASRVPRDPTKVTLFPVRRV